MANPVPTLQQVNLARSAANLALQLKTALTALSSWLTVESLSPSASTILNTDWSNTQPGVQVVPPSLVGLNTTLLSNFLTQGQALGTGVAASNNAILGAIIALAEYAG